MGMVNVEVNENELRKIYLKKVDEHLQSMDSELLLWDAKELCRQTSMSWNTVLKEFFYDPRFEKYKVGNKWKFPAKEAKAFILIWLREQNQ